MAILWAQSLTPWTDPNGNPYSGAKAYFFDAGTTTPRTVYRDGNLGESHDHPVVANASGMFPAIFLPAGDYRVRLTDASGVTIWDVDGISTPATGDSGGGGGGDTPVELLARTGDFKFRHGTGSHSGWVRANGRTIGNAASGAGERANADCEALFQFLWTVDPTLAVSGGRGVNAASDWAASKTIALPDMRQRAHIGLATMGASAQNFIPSSLFDGGETNDTLGATVGVGQVTLTTQQMPSHTHSVSGTASSSGSAHQHQISGNDGQGSSSVGTGGGGSFTTHNTTISGAHSHSVTGTAAATGGDDPHINVQPSMAGTCYIKL